MVTAEPEANKTKRLRKPKPDSVDREMELTEHLAELRTRIIRSILYVTAGMVVAWLLYGSIYGLLFRPVAGIHGVEWSFIFTSFMEPFFVKLQVSAVVGIIFAFPLLTMELWGFVSPALTRTERKGVVFVAPLCVILFAFGVACAVFVLSPALRWFLSYIPENARLMQKVNDYVLFLAKLSLAFGIVFQLPVVLLFLGKIGLINSRFMIKYWRQAILLSAAISAVATPSQDAFTMTAMTFPLIVLYVLSIGLVRLVERPRTASDGEPDGE